MQSPCRFYLISMMLSNNSDGSSSLLHHRSHPSTIRIQLSKSCASRWHSGMCSICSLLRPIPIKSWKRLFLCPVHCWPQHKSVLIDLKNILSWKETTRIIKCNSAFCKTLTHHMLINKNQHKLLFFPYWKYCIWVGYLKDSYGKAQPSLLYPFVFDRRVLQLSTERQEMWLMS